VGEERASSSRVSVYEAAEALGVTVDAIRKRISRGTIPHERDEHGRVWVILDVSSKVRDAGQDTYQPPSDSTTLISEMRGRIEDLRSQLESERQAHAEARRIIAGLVERIPPAIEPPRGAPSEAPETVPEGAEPRPGAGGPQTARERPSGATEEERPTVESVQRRTWLWWWAAWILLLLLLVPAVWIMINLF
jgi:hypothetical protein